MLTLEEAPWIIYLEIDDETGKRTLRGDTPQEIRDLYEKHLLEQRKYTDELRPK